MSKLDAFTQAYIECALWASTDFDGENFEQHNWSDLTPKALAEIMMDCDSFQEYQKDNLALAGTDEQNGHDFFLTRNRHGAGFWERGYGAVGDALTEAAHAYGTQEIDWADDTYMKLEVHG